MSANSWTHRGSLHYAKTCTSRPPACSPAHPPAGPLTHTHTHTCTPTRPQPTHPNALGRGLCPFVDGCRLTCDHAKGE